MSVLPFGVGVGGGVKILSETCRQVYMYECRVFYMNTETIAQAPTAHGFGIAVLRNLRSDSFHVARYATRGTGIAGKFVVISNHATEADARARANREWAADKAAA